MGFVVNITLPKLMVVGFHQKKTNDSVAMLWLIKCLPLRIIPSVFSPFEKLNHYVSYLSCFI